MTENDKSGSAATTRVFKKSSPNGKITTYLGKRDFIDSGSDVDPVDGVILVDPDYLKNRKVFVNILAAFRYGREDLDVLGLTFRKDLFSSTIQVYPPLEVNRAPNTQLQVRLLRKLGSNAYPFCFKIPQNAASSVTLQPAPEDTGKPCGVDYELKSWVAESENEKPHKRNSVTLAIRKLTYAPNEQGPQPSASLQHSFLLSSGTLNLEASLDKEKFYHGENISVYLLINNNSSKKIKKINISVTQISDIILFSKASYKCVVAEIEPDEGMPILPNSTTFSKVYQLCPTLDENRDKRGLALDGKLKHEDTNLASSTIIKLNTNEADSMSETTIRENLGIVVQYRVKVKIVCGMLSGGDLTLELPFTLTHPKPVSPPPSRPVSAAVTNAGEPAAVDMNLIELEETENAPTHDDDIIFEDFARLRLRGMNDGEEAEA